MGDQDLEPVVAGQIDHDPGIMRIILDDEQNHVALLQLEPVVGDLLHHPLRYLGKRELFATARFRRSGWRGWRR